MESNDEQKERDKNHRKSKPSRFSELSLERSNERKQKDNQIYVSNIPYDYKWTDVKDLFRKHVGDVVYVELFNDENDKPRGCGIVEFPNTESVKKAMEVMHRFTIQGRNLVIKEDFGHERNKHGYVVRENKDNRDNRPPDYETGEMCNTFGLSTQFLTSIGIQPPLCNRIFVANLDYKVDKVKLKEVFKMAGKVRSIDLSLDKDGNSRGFAVIEYDHPVEAVQAISMFDRQFLYERKLTVRMDRVSHEKKEIQLPDGLKNIGAGLGPNGEALHDVARHVSQNMVGNQNASSILGAFPSAGLALNNLNMPSFGSNNVGMGNLGLQSFGLSGIGATRNQIMQEGFRKNDFPMSSSSSISDTPMGITRNIAHPVSNGSGRFMNNQQDIGSPFNTDFVWDSQHNSSLKAMDTIKVRNLPVSWNWNMIQAKFNHAGNIKFGEKSGKDMAIIRYYDDMAATRAIKMFDMMRLEGRHVNVSYYY